MTALKTFIVKYLLIFTIVSLAGLSAIYNYQQVITYFIVPLVFFTGLSLNNFRFSSLGNKYSKYFLGILVLGLLILIFSANLSVGFQNLITLAGVYLTILFTIELMHFRFYDFSETFLHSFVLSFLLLSFFLLMGPGGNQVEISEEFVDRSSFDLNANIYSYSSYFANMALFYLIQIKGNRLYIILSWICTLLGIYLSFITASRSGILFTILICSVYWLLIFNKLKSNTFIKFIIVLSIIGYSINFIYNVYDNSFLKARVDQSLESGDGREVLAMDAIIVFLHHPIVGVGPGQFFLYSSDKHSFSHNSFTEIAANMGIVGITLLLLLFVQPFLKEFKTRNQGDKAIRKLNLLFFASFILYNNFYVFYLTTYGMIFFFLIIMIQKKNWVQQFR
ncbi:MAG TPA: O-antigen ligase family protein [Agriterribacter sp.]|nr:O-antigen ligase family protein [Agriterribacter sp.]